METLRDFAFERGRRKGRERGGQYFDAFFADVQPGWMAGKFEGVTWVLEKGAERGELAEWDGWVFHEAMTKDKLRELAAGGVLSVEVVAEKADVE